MLKRDSIRWGRKVLKTAGVLLAGLAGLVLVALVLAYLFAEPLVGRYLKQQVARQTEGLYTLRFEELQLSPFTMGFTLRNMHLYPDSTVLQQQKKAGTAGSSLLDVQSRQLKVTGLNLRSLLFHNNLQLKEVVAEHPVITITAGAAMVAGAEQKNTNNSNIQQYPDAVTIKNLVLRNGSFRYQMNGIPNEPVHDVPHFSLKLQHLRLLTDRPQNLSDMFSLKGLELNLSNYTYQAPDRVHTIRIEKLTYSSQEQELKAVAAAVAADQQANSALSRQQAHRLLFSGKVPLLQLTGLDMAAAWRTKQLLPDQVILQQPDLQVLQDLTVPDSNRLDNLYDLYARLSPYLQQIGAAELRLTGGSLCFSQKEEAVYPVHQVSHADLTIKALQLDSLTLFAPQEKPFARALHLLAENYSYTPRYSPYTVKAERLEVNTATNMLQADGVLVAGDWNKNDKLKSLKKAKHTLYNIRLPRLRLRDTNLLQALRTSRLAIGSLTAESPEIEVRTDLQMAKPKKPELQQLFDSFAGLVHELEVAKLNITHASFSEFVKANQVQPVQLLTDVSLTATGLLVDSVFVYHPGEKRPLQTLFLTARHYSYRMPDNTYTFAMDGLRYAIPAMQLTAAKIDIISSSRANDRQKQFDNASRNLFDLSATNFNMTHVDLLQAVFTRTLVADQVYLTHPELAMLLDRQVAASEPGQQREATGIFEFVDQISINKILFEDGSFTFSEKLEPVMRNHLLEHVTATASGFKLTSAGFTNLDTELPIQELNLVAQNYTYQSSDSIYVIRLDSLSYSSRQQEVNARSFTVRANRQVNEHLKAHHPGKASRNLVDIDAKHSLITGFNLVHAYATGQYHMEQLLFSEPRVTILQDHNVPANDRDGSEEPGAGLVAAALPGDLPPTFRVGRVQVTDGTFDFNILEDTIRVSQTLAHVSLGIEELRLVSLEATDPLDMFDADDIRLLVQGYSFYTRDSLYAIDVKEIKVAMHDRTLLADSLRLRPLYSKEEYSGKLRYAENRVEMLLPELAVQGLRLSALFNNQDLVAQRLLIRNPEMMIYRDNSIGLAPDRRPPTLQQTLHDVGLIIRIDTALVENARIEHQVIALTGVEPGLLLIEGLQLHIYNLLNDPAYIPQHNTTTGDASLLLMGKSNLQVRFLFRLDNPEDYYAYEGSLEPMDLTELNPLIEKMMFVRIKSGQMQQATFSIESTETRATGQVHFPYNNLKVQLLNKKHPAKPGLLMNAATLLANTLIIKSNNPSGTRKIREGDVVELRDPRRSVFHHMGQSLFNGITTSLMTKRVERIVSFFIEL